MTWFAPPTWVTGDILLSAEQAAAAAMLDAELADGASRLAIIEGVAGTGKSTVVHRFAQLRRDSFPGGVEYAWPQAPQFSWAELRAKADLTRAAALFVIDDGDRIGDSFRVQAQDLIARSADLKIVATFRQVPQLGELPHLRLRLKPFYAHDLGDFGDLLAASRDSVDVFLRSLGEPFTPRALFEALATQMPETPMRLPLNAEFEFPEGRTGTNVVALPTIFLPGGEPATDEGTGSRDARITVAAASQTLLERVRAQPLDLYQLTPRQFEETVAEAFAERGYEVTLTPATRDGGSDLYVARNDGLGRFLFAVECKRYRPSNPVQVGLVRQLYGVVERERATAGVLITTSFFTSSAIKEAEREMRYRLHLNDFDQLVRWIRSGDVLW